MPAAAPRQSLPLFCAAATYLHPGAPPLTTPLRSSVPVRCPSPLACDPLSRRAVLRHHSCATLHPGAPPLITAPLRPTTDPRVGVASFIALLVQKVMIINIKPYTVMLLKLLYTPVLEERSSAANRAFASSCAAILKYASQSQAQKLIEDTASLHLEIAYTENVTEKCDVYSFGVLVMDLFMGSHPGELLSSLSEASKNNTVSLQHLLDSRLELPDVETAGEIYNMLSVAVQCLEPSPSRRPTTRRASDELSASKAFEDHVHYLHACLTIPTH